jgi:uncharacterized protein (DUF2336 family)
MPLATQDIIDPQTEADASIDALSPMTSGARVSMVRKLTDLVVMPLGRLSNNERSFTADLLIRALDAVDVSVRADAARRMAGFAEIPSHLQRYLIRDDISVARPVLELSSHIAEAIMCEAAMVSYDHRKAIVTRDDITSQVADVLINFGETDIIIALLKMEEITFSDQTMDILVSRSQNDIEVRPLLIKRLELRLEHGMSMFWWLDMHQRKAVLQRFSLDRAVIQEAMHSLFVEIFTAEDPDMSVKGILKLIDRRHRPRGRDGEMVTMEIVEKTLAAARLMPNDEFSHAVGLIAGIRTQTATRILNDWSGEAFAVLCKSVGLSRAAFIALFTNEGEVETSGPTYDADKIEWLVGVFDSIARDYSRTILRYWDWKDSILVEPGSSMTPGGEEDAGYFGAV